MDSFLPPPIRPPRIAGFWDAGSNRDECPNGAYGHENAKSRNTTYFLLVVSSCLRGWRRRDGAYGQSARRDRVRSVAQVCAAGRRARAHRLSAIGHGDRGGVSISDRRDDRFRTAAWTAGIAGRGRRADRPPVV